LKALTQDESIVRESLAESSVVTLVDDRIRVNAKPTGQRSTIILREIPSDATEEEIREIFNYEGCRPIQSLHPDIENTWFVYMESEDDVKDTVLDLQLKKRLFRGEKVKVRVKSESSVRSFYPVPSIPPMAPVLFQPYPGYAAIGMPVDMHSYPYIPIAPVPAIPIATSSPSPDNIENTRDGTMINKHDKTSENQVPNGYHSNGNAPSADRKSPSSKPYAGMKDKKGGFNPSSSNGQPSAFKSKKGERFHDRRGNDPSNRRDQKSAPTIEIDSINFPPLHVASSSEDSPAATPVHHEDLVSFDIKDNTFQMSTSAEEHVPADEQLSIAAASNSQQNNSSDDTILISVDGFDATAASPAPSPAAPQPLKPVSSWAALVKASGSGPAEQPRLPSKSIGSPMKKAPSNPSSPAKSSPESSSNTQHTSPSKDINKQKKQPSKLTMVVEQGSKTASDKLEPANADTSWSVETMSEVSSMTTRSSVAE
jgi:hypothetical protein